MGDDQLKIKVGYKILIFSGIIYRFPASTPELHLRYEVAKWVVYTDVANSSYHREDSRTVILNPTNSRIIWVKTQILMSYSIWAQGLLPCWKSHSVPWRSAREYLAE